MFTKLFGTDRKNIKENCIILPSNDRSLFSPPGASVTRGMLFDVCLTRAAALISPKSRWLAGDCVLLLEDTVCRNIFLFGSCAGLQADIAEKGVISSSVNLESFTNLMNFSQSFYSKVLPDEETTRRLKEYASLKSLRCATVSSLVLESIMAGELRTAGVECLDMESSMVFTAAKKTGKKAAALMYVSDLPGEINFYDSFPRGVSSRIKNSRRELARTLREFLKSELP